MSAAEMRKFSEKFKKFFISEVEKLKKATISCTTCQDNNPECPVCCKKEEKADYNCDACKDCQPYCVVCGGFEDVIREETGATPLVYSKNDLKKAFDAGVVAGKEENCIIEENASTEDLKKRILDDLLFASDTCFALAKEEENIQNLRSLDIISNEIFAIRRKLEKLF